MGGGEHRAMLTHGSFARQVMGLAAVAAVAALLLAPGAQARGAKHLFGLNYVFKEMTGKDASMLNKSGATTVRWIMFWPRIEPTSGHFDWSVPDKSSSATSPPRASGFCRSCGDRRNGSRPPRSPRRSTRRLHGVRGRAS